MLLYIKFLFSFLCWRRLALKTSAAKSTENTQLLTFFFSVIWPHLALCLGITTDQMWCKYLNPGQSQVRQVSYLLYSPALPHLLSLSHNVIKETGDSEKSLGPGIGQNNMLIWAMICVMQEGKSTLKIILMSYWKCISQLGLVPKDYMCFQT